MFKIALSPTFRAPVTVEIVGADGSPQKYPFTAEFRRLKLSELEDLMARIRDKGLSDPDVLREVVSGWAQVVDEAGSELPFSADALEQVLEIPEACRALVNAFMTKVTGARRGN